ncbi:MAG: thioredoxin family protein [Flavobacteriales bacterium]|nr:thioredoxin family protein [Flavobacteriales bacterium]MBL0126929.1 thioredoxin family protein [Flavobacteriales bacterium]MCC6938641.1 thioredoxin family protein [Flavobacteriales bacterium]
MAQRSLFLLGLAVVCAASFQPAARAQTPEGGSKLIKWVSIEEAQALAKKAPKPLFIDVHTSWCGPCKMLDARTFADPKLADYVNKHFYAVKFNAESGDPVTFKGQKYENPEFNAAQVGGRNGTHQLTYVLANVQGRIAYPTVVYLDSDLNVLAPVQGLLSPEQMEPILAYFGENAYKTQEYQAYLAAFKSRWTTP